MIVLRELVDGAALDDVAVVLRSVGFELRAERERESAADHRVARVEHARVLFWHTCVGDGRRLRIVRARGDDGGGGRDRRDGGIVVPALRGLRAGDEQKEREGKGSAVHGSRRGRQSCAPP